MYNVILAKALLLCCAGERGCQYGTQAFVDWINDFIVADSEEKAYVVEEIAAQWDERNNRIEF